MVKRTPDAGLAPLDAPAEPGYPQRDPAVAVAPRSGALGVNKELWTNGPFEDYRRGCPRWPQGLLIRWQRGEEFGFIEGRCGAVNRCEYCAIQTAFVNAMMLHLEAELGTPPSVLAILGTRSATSDPKPFYLGRKKVMLALRQPYGRQVEYSSLVEFTTGKAARSGGLRRPHWNLFLKGLPLAELDQVRELVRAIWCKHVDAEPEAQYVEELRDPGAAANYVALHFQKEGQAPPAGWTGQRFNSSRGFFDGRSRAEMRELAELEMKRRRLGWLLSQVFAGDVEDLVQAQLLDQAGTEWELVKTSPRRAELLLAMDPATGEILKRGCLTRPDAAP